RGGRAGNQRARPGRARVPRLGRRKGVPLGTLGLTARRHWQALAGLLALVCGVTLAVLAAAEATRPTAEPPMTSPSGVAVTTSLPRRVILFGDSLIARFDVAVDRRRINPDLVRLETSFVPFTPLAGGRSRRDNGSLTELRYVYTLGCDTAVCLPSMARK